MIYVSSSCLKNPNLFASIDELEKAGFSAIELSGGARHVEDLEAQLLARQKGGLQFRLHNYFPPPQKHFVVNLCASDTIVEKSHELMKKSIEMSRALGSRKVGFHAGFRVSPKPEELGFAFAKTDLMPYEEALERFCFHFRRVSEIAKANGVELYLENNVVSLANYRVYGQDPFLLTTAQGYKDLRQRIDFKLLLDIGHLKVSAQTHELDFTKELDEMVALTDYVHVSDNGGTADDNDELSENSEMFSILRDLRPRLRDIDFTLEVYSGLPKIRQSHELLSSLL